MLDRASCLMTLQHIPIRFIYSLHIHTSVPEGDDKPIIPSLITPPALLYLLDAACISPNDLGTANREPCTP
jgi:hypothetical protein